MSKGKVQGFVKVTDNRGTPVRRLWKRGDVFYVQLRVANETTGKSGTQRFAMGKEITTVSQAKLSIGELVAQNQRGELKGKGGIPTFGDYLKHYLRHANKSKHSMENEESFLTEWQTYFGSDRKLDKINEASIKEHIARLKEDINPRTKRILSGQSRNLRLLALRSILKMAKEEQKITRFPFDGIKIEKYKAEKKKLLYPKDIQKCIDTAIEFCPKSGKAFSDYIKLLMFSGARETEALSLQWDDINFDNKHIRFHRNTKFGKERYLDLNPKLESHLKDMFQRRNKELNWLFPSSRPNLQDGRITNFKITLNKVRQKSGIYISDHDLRHYFASMAVMAGTNIITLSKWLGHEDTKLINEVYGHLNNSFQKSQASQLTNL